MPVACASRMLLQVCDCGRQGLNAVERTTKHLVAVAAEDTAPALWAGLFRFAALVIVVDYPTSSARIGVAADGAAALMVCYLLFLLERNSMLAKRCAVTFTWPTHP